MHPVPQITELTIKKIARGDEQAFSDLYEAYYTYLSTLAVAFVLDEDVAGEMVNDVFLQIWDNRRKLVYPVSAYLIRSLRNRCLNHLRAEKSRHHTLSKYKEQLIGFHIDYIHSNPTPLHLAEFRELEALLKAKVAELPGRCREIFEEYHFGGKSPEEIAENLGISVSTVRVQIKRALDNLRVSLGPLAILLLLFLD